MKTIIVAALTLLFGLAGASDGSLDDRLATSGTATSGCTHVQKSISGPVIWSTADANELCPIYCRVEQGEGWGFSGQWWQDPNDPSHSICVCVDTTSCQNTPAATSGTTSLTVTAPTTSCKKSISVPQLRNTADANAKCPGYCKNQLGQNWGFSGSWWQNSGGSSTCVCMKNHEEKSISVPQLQNTADANAKCPGHCKNQLGQSWSFSGAWWQNSGGGSTCVCMAKVCDTPEPIPTPPPTIPCKNEQKSISVPQIRDTADANKKCPIYCNVQQGEGWGFSGQWWQHPDVQGLSICVCSRKVCQDGETRRLEFEETLEEMESDELMVKVGSLTVDTFCKFVSEQGLCEVSCEEVDNMINKFLPPSLKGLLDVCHTTDMLTRIMCIEDCSE